MQAYMRYFFLIAFTLLWSLSFAQKQRVMIGGYTPGLFVEYPLNEGETFTSIAAKYNLAPDSLAEFNNMDYHESALKAKTLKIPLTPENFDQQGNPAIGEGLVPVYFLATYSQSLQQITTKVNWVPITSLKRWNTQADDVVAKGTELLVGFLKARLDKLAFFEDTVSSTFARVDVQPKDEIEKADVNSTPKPEKSTVIATEKLTKKDSGQLKNAELVNNKSNVGYPNKGAASAAKPKVDSSSLKVGEVKIKDPEKKPGSLLVVAPKIPKTPAKNPITTKQIDSLNLALKTNNKSASDIKKNQTNLPDKTVKIDGDKAIVKLPVKPVVKPLSKKDSINNISNTTIKPNSKLDSIKNSVIVKKPSKTDSAKASAIVTNKEVIAKKPADKKGTETVTNNKTKIDSVAISKVTKDSSLAANSKRPVVITAPKDVTQPLGKGNTGDVVKTATPEPAKNDIKPTLPVKENATEASKTTNNTYIALLNNQAFESVFNVEVADKPAKQLVGDASFFESRSGWNDKKFYVLMPYIAAGTVVKITSKDNKSVYAKVLGTMPTMKENNGILLRLSNSAVAALGINNSKFPVVVSYY